MRQPGFVLAISACVMIPWKRLPRSTTGRRRTWAYSITFTHSQKPVSSTAVTTGADMTCTAFILSGSSPNAGVRHAMSRSVTISANRWERNLSTTEIAPQS